MLDWKSQTEPVVYDEIRINYFLVLDLNLSEFNVWLLVFKVDP